MSQVSTFVLADNGMFYQDPRLGEPGVWFLCFDDDEPPELVIADPDHLHDLPKQLWASARETKASLIYSQVKKAGISFSDSRYSCHALRCFPDHANMKWASSWFGKVEKPIPESLIEGEKQPYFLPYGQHVALDFAAGEVYFPRSKTIIAQANEECWKKLTTMVPHHLLLDFCKSINDIRATLSGEFVKFADSDSGIAAYEFFMRKDCLGKKFEDALANRNQRSPDRS